MKKYLILFVLLILTACSGKSSFTNLKLYYTWNEEMLKTPMEKKSIDEKELQKIKFNHYEKMEQNLLNEFKITMENLNSSVEVEKMEKLKNEKYLEFTFEGKKYEIIIETTDEMEEYNKNKTPETKRNSPLLYVKKYEGDKSKIYKLDLNDIKGHSVLKMAIFLEWEIKK